MRQTQKRPRVLPLALAAMLLAAPLPAAESYLLEQTPPPCVAARVQLEVRGKLVLRAAEGPEQAQTETPAQPATAADKPATAADKPATAADKPAPEAGADAADADAKLKKLPLSVDGELQYHERLLPDTQGRRSAVRHYSRDLAKVMVDGRLFQPRLGDASRLVRVDIEGERISFRCPEGLLSREELDLVAVQGNSLLLHRLLPGKSVELGQQWGIEASAAAPIFGLEQAYSTGLVAELKSVDQGVAVIHLQGPLDGAVEGVSSRIDVEADLRFDLKRRQITQLDAQFNEQRDISGGQPGIQARSRLRIDIEPATVPDQLQDSAIAGIAAAERQADVLRYTSPKQDFSLIHSPTWRIVSATPKRTVLRLLDGGDVVAQGNLSMLDQLPAGRQLTLEAFEEDVRTTLGKLKGQVAQSEESKLSSGLRMLRVTGLGKVQDIDVQWVYLHVSDDQGRRVSCVFTLEQRRAEAFQGAELELLAGLRFETATARAEPATAR